MTTAALVIAWSLCCCGDEPPARKKSGDLTHHFLAEGHQGLVVGLTGQKAVHAGVETLKQGGSAADAVIATALTQIVEAAGSYVSFAGILSLTYYDASTGKVHSLNAGYNTPLDEKDPLSIPKMDETTTKGAASGRTALVPGFMAGIQAAHDRFGKVPFAQLFQPAIDLADKGFTVDPLLAYFIQFRKDVLGRLPETRRLFTKQNGEFIAQGDLFRQPELAATLRHVADAGAAYMSTGEWAQQFVAALHREGGLITARDLAAYRAVWEDPLETSYRDLRVFAPGLSATGGVDTIEALNLLELAGLGQSGNPSRSPESLFWFIQITNNQNLTLYPKLAAKHFPAKTFSAQNRVTKEHARWLWAQMRQGGWPYAVSPAGAKSGSDHSSGVVAVDRWGNVAALTHSCNAVAWGNTGIFVAGVSIPDSASFQQEAIKQAGPGNRIPDPMTPLIVTRAGKPILATSVIGAGLHQRNVQVLANIFDFGIDAQSAVDAPALLAPEWSENRSVTRVGAGSFDPVVLEGVRKLGHEVKVLPRPGCQAFAGFWVGIEIDPKTGHLRGAGTGEVPSYAEGY